MDPEQRIVHHSFRCQIAEVKIVHPAPCRAAPCRPSALPDSPPGGGGSEGKYGACLDDAAAGSATAEAGAIAAAESYAEASPKAPSTSSPFSLNAPAAPASPSEAGDENDDYDNDDNNNDDDGDEKKREAWLCCPAASVSSSSYSSYGKQSASPSRPKSPSPAKDDDDSSGGEGDFTRMKVRRVSADDASVVELESRADEADSSVDVRSPSIKEVNAQRGGAPFLFHGSFFLFLCVAEVSATHYNSTP